MSTTKIFDDLLTNDTRTTDNKKYLDSETHAIFQLTDNSIHDQYAVVKKLLSTADAVDRVGDPGINTIQNLIVVCDNELIKTKNIFDQFIIDVITIVRKYEFKDADYVSFKCVHNHLLSIQSISTKVKEAFHLMLTKEDCDKKNCKDCIALDAGIVRKTVEFVKDNIENKDVFRLCIELFKDNLLDTFLLYKRDYLVLKVIPGELLKMFSEYIKQYITQHEIAHIDKLKTSYAQLVAEKKVIDEKQEKISKNIGDMIKLITNESDLIALEQMKQNSIKQHSDFLTKFTTTKELLESKNSIIAECKKILPRDENNSIICKVCLENKINMAYSTCGHVICNKCDYKLPRIHIRNGTASTGISCPFCRRECTNPIRLIFS